MGQIVVDVNELSRSFGPKNALDHVSFRAPRQAWWRQWLIVQSC
jgi:hypothetical protein